MNDDIEEEFTKATRYVETVATRLDNEKLLYLYARYKQAKEGSCSIPKPGMFDFQGKKKWEAWKKLEGMTCHQAMLEYVSYTTNINPEWTKEKVLSRGNAGLGVSVSTMAATEDQLSDGEKTVFDWCRDGNVDQVHYMITSNQLDVNGIDDEGLALLHWASDRGHKDVAKYLLSVNAQVNVKDKDGQTPLHYAVSCEHADVVSVLVSSGADVHAVDKDGVQPVHLASDNYMLKSILQNFLTKP